MCKLSDRRCTTAPNEGAYKSTIFWLTKNSYLSLCWILTKSMNERFLNKSAFMEFDSRRNAWTFISASRIQDSKSKPHHLNSEGSSEDNLTCRLWQLSQHEYVLHYALCLRVIYSIRECAKPWEEVPPQVILISNEFTSPVISSEVWKKLTDCGRVTQICVFNTVKLGKSASSP